MPTVRCPRCGASHELGALPRPGESLRVSCGVCGTGIRVKGKAGAPSTSLTGVFPSISDAPPPLPEEPEAPRWRVRKADGTVVDFPNLRVFQRWVLDGVVSLDDALSRNGRAWRLLREIPELVGLFERVEATRAQERGTSEPAPARPTLASASVAPPPLPDEPPELPGEAQDAGQDPSAWDADPANQTLADVSFQELAAHLGGSALALEDVRQPAGEPEASTEIRTEEPVEDPASSQVDEPAPLSPVDSWQAGDTGGEPAPAWGDGQTASSVEPSSPGPAQADSWEAPQAGGQSLSAWGLPESTLWGAASPLDGLGGFADDGPPPSGAPSRIELDKLRLELDELNNNTVQMRGPSASEVQAYGQSVALGASAPEGARQEPAETIEPLSDEPAPQSRQWLFFALGVSLTALRAFGGWWVFGRSSPPSPTGATAGDGTGAGEKAPTLTLGTGEAVVVRVEAHHPRDHLELGESRGRADLEISAHSAAALQVGGTAIAPTPAAAGDAQVKSAASEKIAHGAPRAAPAEPRPTVPRPEKPQEAPAKPEAAPPEPMPEVAAPSAADAYDAVLAEAAQAESAGQLGEAIRLLDKASVMNPRSVEPIAKLAWLYLKKGDSSNRSSSSRRHDAAIRVTATPTSASPRPWRPQADETKPSKSTGNTCSFVPPARRPTPSRTR